jgi:hypothetical protein
MQASPVCALSAHAGGGKNSHCLRHHESLSAGDERKDTYDDFGEHDGWVSGCLF